MKALAVYSFNRESPLSSLQMCDMPKPECRPFWCTLRVLAASLNHHDLWSLQGVGLKESSLPMTLGTDACGLLEEGSDQTAFDQGTRVLTYGVIGQDAVATVPTERRSILSEHYQGTMAEYVTVPAANVFKAPEHLSNAEACVLGTSWLTAYSMLFSAAALKPGDTVLIQGATGGVSTAAIQLAHHAGLYVIVTTRHTEYTDKIHELGAHEVLATNERLAKRSDAVLESVGSATWSHSVRSVKPNGVIAVCGATTGDNPPAELTRIFFQNIRVQGVTMGTREDFARLLSFVDRQHIIPCIDTVYHFDHYQEAFDRLFKQQMLGKIVLEW